MPRFWPVVTSSPRVTRCLATARAPAVSRPVSARISSLDSGPDAAASSTAARCAASGSVDPRGVRDAFGADGLRVDRLRGSGATSTRPAGSPAARSPGVRCSVAVLCRGRHELAAMIDHSLPAASLRALAWDPQP